MLGGELDGQRLGGGVRLGGTQTMWSRARSPQTGNPLDLAIRGGGMFVVKGSHDGQTGQYYTRDGRFQHGQQGYVVNQHGLRLQGYTIDSERHARHQPRRPRRSARARARRSRRRTRR